MNNQALTEKVTQLEAKLQELGGLATLKQMVQEQQAEIANLREALARKIASVGVPQIPTLIPTEPTPTRKPDTSRRKMLKRMGVAVLAGGAALGITAATYAPAEAKLSVNPSSNIGAISIRNGATITNFPPDPVYGLIASADSPSIDASGYVDPNYGAGVLGFGNYSIGVFGASNSSIGVRGSSQYDFGMYGTSNSSIGISGVSYSNIGVGGSSTTGTGIVGRTHSDTNPGISAESPFSFSGIALQINGGGFTVKSATINSQTAAFIHQTTAANTSGGYISTIDNALCNGRQNALLFVTHNYNPPNALANNYDAATIGVYYNAGTSRWTIYHEDATTIMAPNTYFNVLIINP